MKILITGGAGYLGSSLALLCLNQGHEVVAYDSLLHDKQSLLSCCQFEKFTFVEGDVRDADRLKSFLDVDFIFPFAAIVGAPACSANKIGASQINLEAIKHLANNTKAKIIFPNTDSGYGTTDDLCTESSPFNPISHYATTKTEAEIYLRANTDAIVLRLGTVFGLSPRMRVDLLVNDFTLKAVKDGYIVLFEENAKRNYVHVQDVARAFLFFMQNFDQYCGEVFNVNLPESLSKLELAQLIARHVPLSIQIDELVQDPDKRNYHVSCQKLLDTGWKFYFNLESGIQEIKRAAPLLLKSKYANV